MPRWPRNPEKRLLLAAEIASKAKWEHPPESLDQRRGEHMHTRRFAALGLLVALWPLSGAASTTFTSGAYQVICVVTSASGTFNSASNNVTYAWDNPVAGPQGLTITISCTSGNAGFTFTVKDEIGKAEFNPILVTANGTDTIDAPGSATGTNIKLNSNYESLTFQCDGAGNWMVE